MLSINNANLTESLSGTQDHAEFNTDEVADLIFDQGYNAAVHRASQSDNPFRRGTDEHDLWLEGYHSQKGDY